MRELLISLLINNEIDLVLARKKARKIANLLQLDYINEIKLATAVSEITRNALKYAGGGVLEFYIEDLDSEPKLTVCVEDKGPGIKNLDDILNNNYISYDGMGKGILGTKNIMDFLDIQTNEKGTKVLFGKKLTDFQAKSLDIEKIKIVLATDQPENIVEELLVQNKEILKTLEEINRKKKELEELNNSLFKTNSNLLQTQTLLKELATKDPLTGAFNRLKLNEVINYEINLVKRYGDPLSIIMLDIDFFKRINDTCGHQVGDRVLQKITELVNNCIRKTDFLFRYGGEEFCILLTKTDAEKAHIVGERIRLTIQKTDFEIPAQITVSLGITQYKKEESSDEAIKRADNALYIAKQTGRNRVVVI